MKPKIVSDIVSLVCMLLTDFVVGYGLCGSLWVASAIKAGVGEYRCNPETGVSQFKWFKSNKEK